MRLQALDRACNNCKVAQKPVSPRHDLTLKTKPAERSDSAARNHLILDHRVQKHVEGYPGEHVPRDRYPGLRMEQLPLTYFGGIAVIVN